MRGIVRGYPGNIISFGCDGKRVSQWTLRRKLNRPAKAPSGEQANTVQRARPAVSTAGMASDGERNDGVAGAFERLRL